MMEPNSADVTAVNETSKLGRVITFDPNGNPIVEVFEEANEDMCDQSLGDHKGIYKEETHE